MTPLSLPSLLHRASALLLCGMGLASAQAPARIEWAELPAAIVAPAHDLKTGYLVVPERRFPGPGARMIRLPFIVMKSRSATPAPDPLLVLAGGPGGSILGRARNRARNPLLGDRDLILLEQRGTLYAEPSLMCPEIDEALRSGWGTRLNGSPDPAIVRHALVAAAARLKKEGVDLAGYTTKESAADVADLRRLLGIEALDLYGVSYSTKIMLEVLRDHPEGIRAVILDSVLPPEANWDEEASANILRVLDQVLALAREDAELRERCGDLKARFLTLLAAANRQPLRVRVDHPLNHVPLEVRLDAAGIMNAVYAALETAGGIRRLPLVLDEACRGNAQALAPALEECLGSSQGSALGMRLSVWCNEEFPFEHRTRMLHPAGLPKALRAWVQTAVTPEALRAWPQGRPDAAENLPVSSEVPVFIASGEFDPDTPPAWARAAASRLSHAQFMAFAGMSHAPLFTHPEAARLMRAFLADPSAALDPGTIGTRPGFAHALETPGH
jgi:pimeloyl-ACP methyl ester carboxylesterase